MSALLFFKAINAYSLNCVQFLRSSPKFIVKGLFFHVILGWLLSLSKVVAIEFVNFNQNNTPNIVKLPIYAE